VQLAEAVDHGLVGAGHVLQLQAGVFIDQLGQDLPHPLFVAVALGLDRQAVHRPGKGQRREVDVIVLGGVVQDRVEADLVDLGDRGDVARQRLRDFDMVLALEHEEPPDLEGLPAVADVQQAVLGDRPLVNAEHAEPADEGIDRHLEHMGQDVPGRVGQRRRAARPRPLAAQEVRRVGLGGIRQQLDDDVEQLGHAGAASGRDEAHRDQVALAQRLLQRRVQLRDIDVALIEIAVDEIGVHLDDLLDQRPVHGIDAAESLCPSRLWKQSTTRLPPASGRLTGRHSLPNAAWICCSTPGRSTPGASILLTMIRRSRWREAACSIMRTAIGSTPVTALMTTATVSTAFERRQALPEEVGERPACR
jgi:hypothetical protein